MHSGAPSKKRRGGLHQRLAAANRELELKSSLYSLLMLHYGGGLMSGALVHSIAVAAQKDLDKQKDGYKITDLQKIAPLKRGKKFGPSLTRMMAKEADLPNPFEVDIQCKEAANIALLLPYRIFCCNVRERHRICQMCLASQQLTWGVVENLRQPSMHGWPHHQAGTREDDLIGPAGARLGRRKDLELLHVAAFFMVQPHGQLGWCRASGRTPVYLWRIWHIRDERRINHESFLEGLAWSFEALAQGQWQWVPSGIEGLWQAMHSLQN